MQKRLNKAHHVMYKFVNFDFFPLSSIGGAFLIAEGLADARTHVENDLLQWGRTVIISW